MSDSFVTPWTAAHQASLSITNSWNLLKIMSIESVMPANHLILSQPLLFLPSIFLATGSFPVSQFFASGGQSIGVSASTSVLPMNIQDWFLLGWTDFISLQSSRLSNVFSNTKHFESINSLALSLPYGPSLTYIHDIQAGFRKGRGTRDQIANICWIMEKAREFRKTSISTLLTMPSFWLCGSQ